MLNKDLRSHCVRAGAVVLDSSFAVHQYLGPNIKLVIHLLSESRHSLGRTTDDKRSVVQSIVMVCLPPTNFQGKNPSDRSIAAALGLSECAYRKE